MDAVLKYRHYPDAVKLEVAKANNPYHFPELEIPRTTALYWIKNSRKTKQAQDSLVESE